MSKDVAVWVITGPDGSYCGSYDDWKEAHLYAFALNAYQKGEYRIAEYYGLTRDSAMFHAGKYCATITDAMS